MIRYKLLASIITSLILGGHAANAYELATHDRFSLLSGKQSQADSILKEHLGVNGGLDFGADGLALSAWIGEGAKREDNVLRLLNHFHNPLAGGWSQAGLLGSVGQSSIVWGQNKSQGFPGWSWADVRQRHFEALTQPQPSERASGLAKTFEGLGRQMHLVQ